MEKIEIKCTEETLNFMCVSIVTNHNNAEINKYFGFDISCKLWDERIKALKQCFNRKEPPRWRAEKDELYYQVNDLGYVIPTTDWHNSTDDKLYNSGNYFKTAEEAQVYAEKWRELFGKRV